MIRLFPLLILGAIAAVGFGWGIGFFPYEQKRGAEIAANIAPEKDLPASEFKSFAIVLYAHNDAVWVERSLRSIFEQDHEYFRLIFVDDASQDGTLERVQDFIVQNSQEHRTILIRNEKRLGFASSLYRASSHCLNRELMLPLSACNWLASPMALSRFNEVFQNQDVWFAMGRMIRYPSYELLELSEFERKTIERNGYGSLSLQGTPCFYTALFKQLLLQDLLAEREFNAEQNYLIPLLELSGGRAKTLMHPIAFANAARGYSPLVTQTKWARPKKALAQFPQNTAERPEVEIVLFSEKKPLQLFATLESLQKYASGYKNITVFYKADEKFGSHYRNLSASFPEVRFAEMRDLKRSLLPTMAANMILIGSDDSVVKDYIDIPALAEMMEKTQAREFDLAFGRNIEESLRAMPLAGGIQAAVSLNPRPITLTLCRKDDLKKVVEENRVRDMRELSALWEMSKHGITLFFEQSKAIRLNLGFEEELVSKFEQGLKIDLEPLFRLENRTLDYEGQPSFLVR